MSAGSMALLEALPVDDRRGTGSMVLFIATEALLFVTLFFTYFYLGRDAPLWPTDAPPKVLLATLMLIALFSSSIFIVIAEHAAEAGVESMARIWVTVAILLGALFLGLQFFEYREHLRTLKPTTDAYGSIFYTITSVHALHVALGLCMFGYSLQLPRLAHTKQSPHRPLHNAALYWHFVDAVWVLIVLLLYYLPHVHR